MVPAYSDLLVEGKGDEERGYSDQKEQSEFKYIGDEDKIYIMPPIDTKNNETFRD